MSVFIRMKETEDGIVAIASNAEGMEATYTMESAPCMNHSHALQCLAEYCFEAWAELQEEIRKQGIVIWKDAEEGRPLK